MDLNDFLSHLNFNNRFVYRGSLTTPPFSENLLWTVLPEVVSIQPLTLALLHEHRDDHVEDGKSPRIGGTNRHTFKHYHRHIYKVEIPTIEKGLQLEAIAEKKAGIHESAISTGAIVVYFMLLAYLCIGTLIERYHISFGHEASFTILIGMAISFMSYMHDNEELINLLKFSDDTFFFVCLPPIVFASGFNMQRGNFFANIQNISIFGIFGTFVAFTSFSLATIHVKDSGIMT